VRRGFKNILITRANRAQAVSEQTETAMVGRKNGISINYQADLASNF